MLAYTIAPALESGIFERVIVSTDSEEVAPSHATTARRCRFCGRRSSPATPPDIEWLAWTLEELGRLGLRWDAFSLLRPTSPFRTAGTIRRAWSLFTAQAGVDSLRAIEKCAQHPGKMWW